MYKRQILSTSFLENVNLMEFLLLSRSQDGVSKEALNSIFVMAQKVKSYGISLLMLEKNII